MSLLAPDSGPSACSWGKFFHSVHCTSNVDFCSCWSCASPAVLTAASD